LIGEEGDDFSFLDLRKGLRGIDADPGPFRPQHGIT
jgi:hypothetical protein